jgi:hypothetical protein
VRWADNGVPYTGVGRNERVLGSTDARQRGTRDTGDDLTRRRALTLLTPFASTGSVDGAAREGGAVDDDLEEVGCPVRPEDVRVADAPTVFVDVEREVLEAVEGSAQKIFEGERVLWPGTRLREVCVVEEATARG